MIALGLDLDNIEAKQELQSPNNNINKPGQDIIRLFSVIINIIRGTKHKIAQLIAN